MLVWPRSLELVAKARAKWDEKRAALWFVLTLLGIGIIINIPLLAIPGYFSHDELEFGARVSASFSEIPWAS